MDQVLLSISSESRNLDLEYLTQLQKQLSQDGVHASMTSNEVVARTYGPAIARKMGMTAFMLSGSLVLEGVIPKDGAAPTALDLISLYVDGLRATRSLAIIDPYFLQGGPDYLTRFDKVFGNTLQSITALMIVHKVGKQAKLLDLQTHMANTYPSVAFSNHPVTDIHDRIWISDAASGLFIGTSLNGLGCKFCLAEYLDATDTNDVIAEMKTLGVTIS
ncbi:MAG: hypothetical protein K1X78_19985 [Verrucomicrobiaceae bacterium]|nr:hypothetical protein [Verrucomicrobiaceae bacterium]